MNYNHVFKGSNAELADFACRFIEDRGALLEAKSDYVNALLPPDLSKIIDAPEYIRITSEKEADDKPRSGKQYPIHFGSPLLEKMTQIAGSRPPLLRCEVKFTYIKTSGFDHLIQEQFDFHKTTGSVSSVGEFRTQYILLTYKYIVHSDEEKEGLLSHALNTETFAVIPEMTEQLPHLEKKYSEKAGPAFTQEQVDQLLNFSKRHVSESVETKIVNFRNSMNRRFARDMKSLNDYYRALESEMKTSMERTGLSEKLKAERMEKIALIPEELAAKKKDLLTKFSIRAKVSLVAAMMVTTPAVKVMFTAMAGHRKRELAMTYNPITKRVDPLRCESCGRGMYRIGFCGRMHLVCASCQAKQCHACK